MWSRAANLYTDFARLPDVSASSIRGWLASVFNAWQLHRDSMSTMLRELLAEISADSRERHELLVASLIGDGRHWQHLSREETRRRAHLLIFQLERTMTAFHIEGWAEDRDALLDTLTQIWTSTIHSGPKNLP
jgi:hypothetical protein